MTHRESLSAHQCPTLEMWYAYVDGSLGNTERERLTAHLQQCDRCFAQVTEIRSDWAEAGETMRRTPPDLLVKAKKAAGPLLPKLWLAYAAAAVVVLAVGLQSIYRRDPSSLYTMENASGRLSALDGILTQRGHSWSAVSLPLGGAARERGAGLAGIPLQKRTIFGIGTILVQLRLNTEYRDDRQSVRSLLAHLSVLLASLPSVDPSSQHARVLTTQLDSNAPAPAMVSSLDDLQRGVEAAFSQDPDAFGYYSLAVWLESTGTAARVADDLMVPFVAVNDLNRDRETTARLFADLRNSGAPGALLDALEQLRRVLLQEDADWTANREIADRVESIQQALMAGLPVSS